MQFPGKLGGVGAFWQDRFRLAEEEGVAKGFRREAARLASGERERPE